MYSGFPDSSVGKESACHAGDPGLIPGSGRSAGEGKGYPFQYSFFFFFNFIFKLYIIVLVLPNIKMNPPQVYMCSSWASLVAQLIKNLPTIRETWGSIPGLARSPGEGKGYPLQYSGVENSMDCIVHGVTKSQTGLSDFHFHFHVYISNWTTLNFKEKASRDFCVKWLK